MSAHEPGEASTLFERYFADGDLDGLMSLYENEAVFPTTRATATGQDEIRQTLKAYLDLGATLVFGPSLVFPAGDLALIHTPWTMHMPNGSSSEGATAEVVRRQADGTWNTSSTTLTGRPCSSTRRAEQRPIGAQSCSLNGTVPDAETPTPTGQLYARSVVRAIAPRVLREVLLVVLLGEVELRRLADLGRDRAVAGLRELLRVQVA